MHRPEISAERVSSGAALAVIAIGSLVLLGWALDVEPLRRLLFPGLHMLPNTAVGALLGGTALWLRQPKRDAGASRIAGYVLATVVLALGAVTFVERVTDWDAGIDLLLFPELVGRHPYRPPGRMATNSTVSFALAGAALLTLSVRRVGRPTHWLSSAGLAIASLALVGHLYGAPIFYTLDSLAGMAIPTALAFFLLHLGILCARPIGGWVGLLLGRDGGGLIARRLLATVAIVPLALGWLIIQVRESGLASRETAIAAFVVSIIAILLTVALHGASVVRAGERVRQAALEREGAAREEAERATRAKDDFLAVMSHELRTPLNAIIGYGSLLADGISGPVTPPQQRQLERIASSARHLLALIDEVLTLSRIELGSEATVIAPVPVTALVDDAATMVEPQARAKGLGFVVSPVDPSLFIETDAGKLRQALVNLLGNAVKFTDRGEVRLRVSYVPEGEVLAFDVEDTGRGIAAEHLDRIFDSFWQVEKGHSRTVEGVGLGLHITRRIVRLLGGDVTVRSAPGDGSCFTVRVPRNWWGRSTGTFNIIPEHAVGGAHPTPLPAASRTSDPRATGVAAGSDRDSLS
jgi:signal transduction histidine kinase